MTSPLELPSPDAERLDAMEQRIVSAHREGRVRRRRRVVGVVGAAATVLVLAAVVGPVVAGGGVVGGAAGNEAGSMEPFADAPVAGRPFSDPVVPDPGLTDVSGLDLPGADGTDSGASGTLDAPTGAADRSTPGAAGDGLVNREIVTTASATVQVPDVPDAIAELAATAGRLGGYVEASDTSSSDRQGSQRSANNAATPVESGYLTMRVPADSLSDAQGGLADLGTVTASTTNRQDVTAQAVDLRARVDATRTSVERLQTLLSQAGSVADLLAAETQLAERQATLESYQQQLTALEGQVSLSALTVSLTVETPVQSAEPAGFLDGLVSGWNGLIASANALLIGLGFLLPWLIIAGAVTAIVVGVRRARRRHRDARG